MKGTTREKIGFGLLALTALGGVIAMKFAPPPEVTVHDGGRSSVFQFQVSQTDVIVAYHVPGIYLIPLLVCGATGLACLLWPSRKAPADRQPSPSDHES
jgi:hypothetical protein